MKDEEKKKRSRSSFIPQPSALIPSLVRVFCAVELPFEVRTRAADHIARLRDAVQGVRASWERAEKLHITLKFLGEIAPKRLQALSDAASLAAQRMQPFTLALEGAGAVSTRRLPPLPLPWI